MTAFKWKDPAVPRVVFQFIPVCKRTRSVLLLHRSHAVRSAPNCWSFPSGLHDIGETLEQGIAREAKEELNLEISNCALLGVYENIAGDDPEREQYHWTILMYAAYVDSFADLINVEDDKHDRIAEVTLAEFFSDEFFETYSFHPTLGEWLRQAMADIHPVIA